LCVVIGYMHMQIVLYVCHSRQAPVMFAWHLAACHFTGVLATLLVTASVI